MNKTLDDVKSVLMQSDDGNDLYECVSNAILQEREKGKGMVKDVQSKLERVNSVLSQMGYDSTSVDLDSFALEIKSRLENAKTNGKKLTTTEQKLQDLEGSIEQLKSALADSQTEANTFKTNYKNSKIMSILQPALSDKLYSADIHSKDIIREKMVALSNDEKSVVWVDGDNQVDFATGLQKYLDLHKSDLKNNQKPGSDSKPSQGDYNPDIKRLSKSAYDKLNPYDRAKFFKNGGEIIDN